MMKILVSRQMFKTTTLLFNWSRGTPFCGASRQLAMRRKYGFGNCFRLYHTGADDQPQDSGAKTLPSTSAKKSLGMNNRGQYFKLYWANADNRTRRSELRKLYYKTAHNRTCQSEKMKRIWANTDIRARVSEKMKLLWANPDKQARRVVAYKQTLANDPKLREEISKRVKLYWTNADNRTRQCEKMKLYFKDAHNRTYISQKMKLHWADAELRACQRTKTCLWFGNEENLKRFSENQKRTCQSKVNPEAWEYTVAKITKTKLLRTMKGYLDDKTRLEKLFTLAINRRVKWKRNSRGIAGRIHYQKALWLTKKLDEGLNWPAIERILKEKGVLEIVSEEFIGFVERNGDQPDDFDKQLERSWRMYHLTARQEEDEDIMGGDGKEDLTHDEDHVMKG